MAARCGAWRQLAHGLAPEPVRGPEIGIQARQPAFTVRSSHQRVVLSRAELGEAPGGLCSCYWRLLGSQKMIYSEALKCWRTRQLQPGLISPQECRYTGYGAMKDSGSSFARDAMTRVKAKNVFARFVERAARTQASKQYASRYASS